MKYQGTFSVRAPRDRVFTFLLNPDDLSSCIEDPHTVEPLDADRFRGTLRSGIGPVRGTFTWLATVAERAPPGRARIQVHGSGMGNAFDLAASFELTEAAGATTMAWRATVIMSGSIASLGARLLQGTIEKKTNAFFENVRKKLESA